MRQNWIGSVATVSETGPNFSFHPACARVALPQRIAGKRKLIKDGMDEALCEVVEQESHEERCQGSVRV
jgi:hypothetical protein